ncbi:MAG TPA: methyltransferase domain-containing protein [Verrucomicrobiae bacterium]|nr:methyltransferase domain-containing protein [Verrucomicrobiae bacterium]
MREWFENEGFWRELYPVLFDEARFARAAAEVGKILRLARRRQGAVLDLCCGPGRHSIELARRGFNVTGVDRTAFLLNKAKRFARKARVKVEFVLSDMRDFVRPGTFDLALCLWTSFGYFDNKAEDFRVLENVFRSLKSRGVLVVDVFGKERLAKDFQGTTSQRLPNSSLFVQQHEIFDEWSRIRNEWILIRGNRARTFRFHHTMYSGQELKNLLRRAGFVDVKLYGDLDGQAYGADARRLVAVARKAGAAHAS